MPYNKTLMTTWALLLVALLSMMPASANEEELCSPFKDTDVDRGLIQSMLKSAIDGNLYRIKADSSRMGFCVDSSVGLIKGDFKQFKGGIKLTDDGSETLVSVDVNSLDTDTVLIDKLLKSDEFLYTDRHPELIFASSSFEWIDEKNAILKGLLTMRGVTKAVAFYVQISEVDADLGDSEKIMVKATTTVERAEFGMSSLSKLVDDKVNLCMSIEAEKYRA